MGSAASNLKPRCDASTVQRPRKCACNLCLTTVFLPRVQGTLFRVGLRSDQQRTATYRATPGARLPSRKMTRNSASKLSFMVCFISNLPLTQSKLTPGKSERCPNSVFHSRPHQDTLARQVWLRTPPTLAGSSRICRHSKTVREGRTRTLEIQSEPQRVCCSCKRLVSARSWRNKRLSWSLDSPRQRPPMTYPWARWATVGKRLFIHDPLPDGMLFLGHSSLCGWIQNASFGMQ